MDDSLSTTLSKIENVHAAMVNLNVVTRVKKRSVWLIVMMFLIDYAMNVFFRGSNIIAENSRTPWSFTKQVIGVLTNILHFNVFIFETVVIATFLFLIAPLTN